MPVIKIDDVDDPRIAAYTSIRERDLTRNHGGRFIVEGKVTLEALLKRSRFAVESLFLCENRLAPLEDVLCEVTDAFPIYITSQDLMDKIAGYPVHRGVLACGQKGTPLNAGDLLSRAEKVLVLIGLSNHDNVGACFRNAAAFGADAVLLDETSCDPLYRKSIRVSAGAALTVPFAHANTGETLFDQLDQAKFPIWGLTPYASATSLYELTPPNRLALVLGAEGPGLPENLIARAKSVRIPMIAGFDSVNVATAGAIALSAVFKQ